MWRFYCIVGMLTQLKLDLDCILLPWIILVYNLVNFILILRGRFVEQRKRDDWWEMIYEMIYDGWNWKDDWYDEKYWSWYMRSIEVDIFFDDILYNINLQIFFKWNSSCCYVWILCFYCNEISSKMVPILHHHHRFIQFIYQLFYHQFIINSSFIFSFSLSILSFSFPFIFSGQISQMFVGTFICGASWYYVKFTDRPCSNDYSNLVAGLKWCGCQYFSPIFLVVFIGALMYGSYLFLFVEFAVKKFLFSSSPVVDKTEKKD